MWASSIKDAQDGGWVPCDALAMAVALSAQSVPSTDSLLGMDNALNALSTQSAAGAESTLSMQGVPGANSAPGSSGGIVLGSETLFADVELHGTLTRGQSVFDHRRQLQVRFFLRVLVRVWLVSGSNKAKQQGTVVPFFMADSLWIFLSLWDSDEPHLII